MAKRSKPEDESAKRILEAIAGAIGAILALGTIGIVAWDGISGDGNPPVIVVEPGTIHAHENGFVLEFFATNRGDEAAAQVGVEGTLSRGGEIVETSETTFDYIPSGSRKRGGLFFEADPRENDIALKAKGYIGL